MAALIETLAAVILLAVAVGAWAVIGSMVWALMTELLRRR